MLFNKPNDCLQCNVDVFNRPLKQQSDIYFWSIDKKDTVCTCGKQLSNFKDFLRQEKGAFPQKYHQSLQKNFMATGPTGYIHF